MLFVMLKGVTPMWEDKNNRNGGCFSYKVVNKFVFDVWKELVYLLCTNKLTVTTSHMLNVNGVTISPKRNFYIIKIMIYTIIYIIFQSILYKLIKLIEKLYR
jgi:Eukaryotic initiation factor 4E